MSETKAPPGATINPIAYPLDDFYARAGRGLPRIVAVNGADIPEPQRTLLVHDTDMTPTLERFHGGEIHLRVIHSEEREGAYYREVVLMLDGLKTAVEFGAIKINLGLFPPGAQKRILEEDLPLGTVLAQFKVKHTSRPKAYLKIEADEFICQALNLDPGHTLYGRRNTLFDPQHRALAEIVEILPPVITRES